ncbi:MAG TPA: histidine kinase [Feifaniaceae bacterium]|nr:histidine kinase [Feifaniaceae bacterium]
MKKRAFVRQIILYMAGLVLLLALVLAAYATSSYSTLRGEIEQSAENFLQVYGGELKSRVQQMDQILQNLLVQNYSALQIIKSPEEAKRVYASLEIKSYIADLLRSDDTIGCIVAADRQYDICVDAAANSLGYWDRTAMRNYTKACAAGTITPTGWSFVTLNGQTYLTKSFVYNGRSVTAFTNTTDVLATIPAGDYGEQTFVLTDEEKLVADSIGEPLAELQIGQTLSVSTSSRTLLVSYSVIPGQISLHSVVQNLSVWNQVRSGTALVLAAILFTIFFGFLLIRYVRKQMIQPMNAMTEGMKRIDHGEYELRIEGEYATSEFTHLKETFNKLMDEIVHLKIQSYEKIIALKDMELRSIRLQIKPHFFLNAISTLSSMNSQGRNQQIKGYVEALSKNIRYMFKSGLHTVPVKEEIRHIENYFDMQEFKYPNCAFYFIDLPAVLESWRIPQMLIQTFVENEFKYAVSVDAVLTVLIKVSLEEHNGLPMLLVEIEDDGKGYPRDVLRYMNGQGKPRTADGSRVGLWSVKRMLELMYERTDLLELKNIEPHGCLNKIWVPAEPVHEFSGDGEEDL